MTLLALSKLVTDLNVALFGIAMISVALILFGLFGPACESLDSPAADEPELDPETLAEERTRLLHWPLNWQNWE